jgi:hypothetical protein
MKTVEAKETIKHVSGLLESKKRFAFVTYTRSALFSVIDELKGEKKTPKYFSRSILSGLASTDPYFNKAVQKDFVSGIEDKVDSLGLKDTIFYDSSYLEYYLNNNSEVFDIFTSYYFKNTKCLVISFQYKSLVSKYFSKGSSYIHVPYNDFYDKIDSVVNQITEFSNEYDICVLDCPMFSSAIAPKIWEKTNMSIIDLGKSLTVARALSKSRV